VKSQKAADWLNAAEAEKSSGTMIVEEAPKRANSADSNSLPCKDCNGKLFGQLGSRLPFVVRLRSVT
jgi:hypothetical protein